MHIDDGMDRIAEEALLDAVAGPAFLVDRDYRYLALNRANSRIVKSLYGVEPVVGTSLLDVVNVPGDLASMRAHIDRALEGETNNGGDWFGHEDGRSFFSFTYAPVVRDGVVIGVAAVAVDTTDLLLTQDALLLSEQKFEAAFESSPDAININRLSDGLYIDINRGFTELTGFTREDVLGKSSLELSVWDDSADRDRLIAGLQADGHVDRLEARFRRKDGSVAVAEMSARIIDVGGHPCILSVTQDVSMRKEAEAALQASYDRLERLSHDVVTTLGRVVEARDPYTQGHELRAAELCRSIAEKMGLPQTDVDALETAALVHDIGKLSVPAEILTKPGNLSPIEFEIIRQHPEQSYEILKDIAFEGPIAEIVLQHHERMDGSGYPLGLRGDQIRRSARILAVADVVEAMATHRPYRPALGIESAMEELRLHSEKYDSDVVTAFLALCDGDRVAL